MYLLINNGWCRNRSSCGKGKNIWGIITLGDRGQIVIPKAARDHLGIKGGDRLIVASDEVGIALIPAEYFENKLQEIMEKIY